MMDREMQKRIMATLLTLNDVNHLRKLVIDLLHVDFASTQEEYRLWDVIHAQQAEIASLRAEIVVLRVETDDQEPT